MTNYKRTPGRLKQKVKRVKGLPTEEHYREIVAGKGFLDSKTKQGFFIHAFINPEDARHLVACWNAFVSLGPVDPEQWVAMAKSHIEASALQAAQNQRLKAERDQLRSQLKEWLANHDASLDSEAYYDYGACAIATRKLLEGGQP